MFAAAIIVIIFVAEDRGWRMKRYPFIDKMIKGPLRKLREENFIIKISFKAVEIGFISILILYVFSSETNTYLFFGICTNTFVNSSYY